MSNIPVSFEQQKQPGARDYLAYLSRVLIRMWGQLAQVINGNIQLYYRSADGTFTLGNIKGFMWHGDLTNQATVITHDLGYIPSGFITLRITSSTVPYLVAADQTTVTVDCNGNAPDTVLLII